jgi:hypothetical protein
LIIEIAGKEDATARYKSFFPETAHELAYIELVTFLSRTDLFEPALEELSALIWHRYNSPPLLNSRNRYTRTLMSLGSDLGLSNDLNVVLTDAADPTGFGELIRGGHLWKDSFAPGHGEFSHSYQWLSAGYCLWNGAPIREIYSGVAGVKSIRPLFVKDEGPISLRSANLWEWLVDCTRHSARFDGQVGEAADTFVKKQLRNWCANKLTNSWFVHSFLIPEDPGFKPVIPNGMYEKELKDMRGKKEAETWAKELERTFHTEIADYCQGLVQAYPIQNALSTTCRNANKVADLAREAKANKWFISFYEQHRSTTLKQREDAAISTVMAHRLAGKGSLGDDPNTIKQRLDQSFVNVDSTHKKYWDNLMKASRDTLGFRNLPDLNESLKVNNKPFGVVDVGKEAVKRNYRTPPKLEDGWRTNERNAIFTKQASGGDHKPQIDATFHGIPGWINVNPGRALE